MILYLYGRYIEGSTVLYQGLLLSEEDIYNLAELTLLDLKRFLKCVFCNYSIKSDVVVLNNNQKLIELYSLPKSCSWEFDEGDSMMSSQFGLLHTLQKYNLKVFYKTYENSRSLSQGEFSNENFVRLNSMMMSPLSDNLFLYHRKKSMDDHNEDYEYFTFTNILRPGSFVLQTNDIPEALHDELISHGALVDTKEETDLNTPMSILNIGLLKEISRDSENLWLYPLVFTPQFLYTIYEICISVYYMLQGYDIVRNDIALQQGTYDRHYVYRMPGGSKSSVVGFDYIPTAFSSNLVDVQGFLKMPRFSDSALNILSDSIRQIYKTEPYSDRDIADINIQTSDLYRQFFALNFIYTKIKAIFASLKYLERPQLKENITGLYGEIDLKYNWR